MTSSYMLSFREVEGAREVPVSVGGKAPEVTRNPWDDSLKIRGSLERKLFGSTVAVKKRFILGISRSPFHGSLEMTGPSPMSF